MATGKGKNCSTIIHDSLIYKQELSRDVLESMCTLGLGTACHGKLKERGWENLAAGFLGFSLLGDNKRISTGNLYLCGSIFPTNKTCCSFTAKRLWPDIEDNIKLNFGFENLALFQLRENLVSDYIDGSNFTHSVVSTTQDAVKLLSPAEAAEAGLGNFCVRAFVHPISESYLKLVVLIFPQSKDDLLDLFPLAINKGFPGMSLLDKDIPIIPGVSDPWRLPFLPFLVKGSPSTPLAVEGQDLREKVAALLQSGTKPAGSKTLDSLGRKWEKIDKSGESALPDCIPSITWPTPVDSPQITEGKSFLPT